MRIQIIGTPDSGIYDLLIRELSAGRMFFRAGTERKNSATFEHKNYPGVLDLFRCSGDVVLGDIVTSTDGERPSMMLSSFVEFICRRLGDSIYTVSLQFD